MNNIAQFPVELTINERSYQEYYNFNDSLSDDIIKDFFPKKCTFKYHSVYRKKSKDGTEMLFQVYKVITRSKLFVVSKNLK